MGKKTSPKVMVAVPLDQFRFLYNLIGSITSNDCYEAILDGEMGEPERYTPRKCHQMAQAVWTTFEEHNEALKRQGRVP